MLTKPPRLLVYIFAFRIIFLTVFKNLFETRNGCEETESLAELTIQREGVCALQKLGKRFSYFTQVEMYLTHRGEVQGNWTSGIQGKLGSWIRKEACLPLPQRNRVLLLTVEVTYMDTWGHRENFLVASTCTRWGTRRKMGSKWSAFPSRNVMSALTPVLSTFCSLPILATAFTHSLFSQTSQLTWNEGFSLAHEG